MEKHEIGRLSTDGFVDSTAVYKKLNELCK